MRVVLFAFLFLSAAACTRVPVGYRGIIVHLWGDKKGVDPKPLGVGRHWFSPVGRELHKFPVFRRNYVWANERSIAFQSMDGASINADIGITYEIDPERVVPIFEKFRRGIDEITNVYLKNLVMDALNVAASEMPVESVFGKGRVKLLEHVNKIVIDVARKEGILVDHIYAVGDFRVPRPVVAAINAKIQARQRAQQRMNEVQEAEAEAAKKNAIAKGDAAAAMTRAKADADAAMVRARAEADAMLIRAQARARASLVKAEADATALRMRNKAEAEGNTLLTKSLSPDLIRLEKVRRWDGKMPVYTTGNAIPILNLDGNRTNGGAAAAGAGHLR